MSDWIKTAKVGDKVCCVNASASTVLWLTLDCLKEGKIYTISSIMKWGEEIRVDLIECPYPFKNAPAPFNEKYGYGIHRFRPVQMRQTDISIFQRLLHTAPSELEQS